MDINHFKSLSRKWSFKLREDALDIEQEMIVFYLSRQSQGKSLDIFVPGHEGALFELLKHKIRGNNLESLGVVEGDWRAQKPTMTRIRSSL